MSFKRSFSRFARKHGKRLLAGIAVPGIGYELQRQREKKAARKASAEVTAIEERKRRRAEEAKLPKSLSAYVGSGRNNSRSRMGNRKRTAYKMGR